MRFASVFAAFVTALLSLLLLFGCYKEKTAIENTGAFDDVKQRAENYRNDVEALQQQLDELTKQKAEKEASLSLLESRENYKTQPTAFLTFDGGFSQNTVNIIKTLDANNVKGTFFVVAQNLKGNDTLRAALKAAAESGHRIGIRSYSDELSEIYQSEEAYFEDLYACRDLIKDITGQDAVLVRMPGGTATAQVRFKKYTGSDATFQSVLARLEKEGFMVNDWSVDSSDATQTDIDKIVSKTLDGSEKTLKATYKTCVVLFMDNRRTDQALSRIITGLKDRGYEFATLPTAICITRQR